MEGYTDENGKVTFNLNEGEYSWVASKEGYVNEEGSVNLIEDMNLSVVMEEESLVTEKLLGTTKVILEIADELLSVNEGDPAPSPVSPYTDVQKVYTSSGKDYYIQQRIKIGSFTPA